MKLDLSMMRGVVRSGRQPVFAAASAPVIVDRAAEWYDYMVPTYNQEFPSCVGHATANWIEGMLRKHVSMSALEAGEQIDGDAIWRKAREMFWGGSLDGGLLVDQGFQAAIALGILPRDSVVVRIGSSVAAVSHELLQTPVVQGNAVHDGWARPDPSNGSISLLMPDPFAGHATCVVAVARVDAEHYSLPFLNSWTNADGSPWGRYGYGQLRDDQWAQCLMDDPATCRLPADWTTWRGWERYVIRK
jgi:hypothetical protein